VKSGRAITRNPGQKKGGRTVILRAKKKIGDFQSLRAEKKKNEDPQLEGDH